MASVLFKWYKMEVARSDNCITHAFLYLHQIANIKTKKNFTARKSERILPLESMC